MRSIIFAIILLLGFTSYGFNNNAYFKRLSTSDGLSNGWVRCFFHDNHGFIWVGTADGLNRFDGMAFKTYRPILDNGFEEGNATINEIFYKNNDTLLVCTDLGLYIYSYISDEFTKFQVLKEQIPILCGQYDADGDLWLGTSRGLFKLNEKSELIKQYEHTPGNSQSLSDNYINTILLDSKNNLWFGTKKGLSLYNKSNDSFINFLPDRKLNSISGEDVMSVKEDKHGKIWIGTSLNGVDVLIYKDQEFSFKHICDGVILDLMPDSEDKLWLGQGSGSGLSVIDIKGDLEGPLHIDEYKFDPINSRSISENSIVCLFEDKNKDI